MSADEQRAMEGRGPDGKDGQYWDSMDADMQQTEDDIWAETQRALEERRSQS